jgi:hypothetical protein
VKINKKDFPAVETVDPNQLSTTHRVVELAPSGREDLAFRLMLPVGWADDPSAMNPPGDGADWIPLAVFAPTPGTDGAPKLSASIDVAVQDWALVSVLWRRLEFEVPLEVWAMLQLRSLNVDINFARLWNDGVGLVMDVGGVCAGVVQPPAGTKSGTSAQKGTAVPAVWRAMIRANGPNVFMVWGYATPGGYAGSGRDLLVAGASFRIEQATQSGFEAMHRAAAVNPNFSPAYPASWIHRAAPEDVKMPAGKSGFDLLLIADETLKGYLHIKAIDVRAMQVESMDRLAKDAAEELADGGITLLEPWSPLVNSTILSTPDLEKAFVGKGIVQNFVYELYFGVVRRPPMLFCVTATVAPFEADVMMNLRGQKAYAIALASAALEA